MNLLVKAGGAFASIALLGGTFWAYRTTATREIGTPGLGMQITDGEDALVEKSADNGIPFAPPPADKSGELAVNAYKNVQVLGHLSTGEFTRLMVGITEWVAPNAGCGYCHAPQRDENGQIVRNEDGYPQADLDKMWSDELYSKVVSRRMVQMTMYLNEHWQPHVAKTGVTCWTCHRGNNVPKNIWFNSKPRRVGGYQNGPTQQAVLTSLPANAFESFLVGGDENNIRIQTMNPNPGPNRSSIKQGEWTYSLMMHMSSSLGVNCTYCHNSRAFGDWEQSPPQRTTAWHGIRMVRDLNNDFLIPLRDTYPAYRLGPHGDAPKANCATCHNGAYKPMLGQSMLGDWPSLAKAVEQPERTVVEEEPEEEEAEGTGGGGGAGGGGGEGGADAGAGGAANDDAAPADAGDPAPAPATPSAPAPQAPPAPAPAAPPAPAPGGDAP